MPYGSESYLAMAQMDLAEKQRRRAALQAAIAGLGQTYQDAVERAKRDQALRAQEEIRRRYLDLATQDRERAAANAEWNRNLALASAGIPPEGAPRPLTDLAAQVQREKETQRIKGRLGIEHQRKMEDLAARELEIREKLAEGTITQKDAAAALERAKAEAIKKEMDKPFWKRALEYQFTKGATGTPPRDRVREQRDILKEKIALLSDPKTAPYAKMLFGKAQGSARTPEERRWATALSFIDGVTMPVSIKLDANGNLTPESLKQILARLRAAKLVAERLGGPSIPSPEVREQNTTAPSLPDFVRKIMSAVGSGGTPEGAKPTIKPPPGPPSYTPTAGPAPETPPASASKTNPVTQSWVLLEHYGPDGVKKLSRAALAELLKDARDNPTPGKRDILIRAGLLRGEAMPR